MKTHIENLSPGIVDALRRAVAVDGRIVTVDGDRWISAPNLTAVNLRRMDQATANATLADLPACTMTDIKAMEGLGLVERAYAFQAEAKDVRRVTVVGYNSAG